MMKAEIEAIVTETRQSFELLRRFL